MTAKCDNLASTYSSVLFPTLNVESCISTSENSRNGARYYARDKYTNNLFEVRVRLLVTNTERCKELQKSVSESKDSSNDRCLLAESSNTVISEENVYSSPCYDANYCVTRQSTINGDDDDIVIAQSVEEWSEMLTRTSELIINLGNGWVESLLPSIEGEVENHLQEERELLLLSELSYTLSFCPAQFLSVALPLELYVVKRKEGKECCCVCSIEPIAGLSLGDIVRSGWRVVVEETLNAILVAITEFVSACWYLPEHHNLSHDAIKQVMTLRDGVTERYHSSRWVVCDWSLIPDYNYRFDEHQKWLEYCSVQFCKKLHTLKNKGNVIQINGIGSTWNGEYSRLECFTSLCNFLVRREKYVSETIEKLEHILLASFSEVNVSSCQDSSFLSPMHVESKIKNTMEQMRVKAALLIERVKSTLTKSSTSIVRDYTTHNMNGNGSEHNITSEQLSCEHVREVWKSENMLNKNSMEEEEEEEEKGVRSLKEKCEPLTQTTTTDIKSSIKENECKAKGAIKDEIAIVIATDAVTNSLSQFTLHSSESTIERNSLYASAIKLLQDLTLKEKLTLHQNALRNEQLLINRYRRRNAPLPPLPNSNSEFSFANDGNIFVNSNSNDGSNDNNSNSATANKHSSTATEPLHDERKINAILNKDNYHDIHVNKKCDAGSDSNYLRRNVEAFEKELECFSGNEVANRHSISRNDDNNISTDAKRERESNNNCNSDERWKNNKTNRAIKVSNTLFDIKPLSFLCNSINANANANASEKSVKPSIHLATDVLECQHINFQNENNNSVYDEQEKKVNENSIENILDSVFADTKTILTNVANTRNFLHSVLSRNAFMLASHNSENYQSSTHSPSQEHSYCAARCSHGSAESVNYSTVPEQRELYSRDVQNSNYRMQRTRISSSPYSANSISASVSAMAAGLNTSNDSSFNSSVRLSPLTVSLSAMTTLSKDAMWSTSREKMAMSSQRRWQEETAEHPEHSSQRHRYQSLEKERSPHMELRDSQVALQKLQSSSSVHPKSNAANNDHSKLSKYEMKHSTTRILFDVNDNWNDFSNGDENENAHDDINYISENKKGKYKDRTFDNNKIDYVRHGDDDGDEDSKEGKYNNNDQDNEKGDSIIERNEKRNVNSKQNRELVPDNAGISDKNNEFTREQNILEQAKKWNTSTKSHSTVIYTSKDNWYNYLSDKRQKGHSHRRAMLAAESAKNTGELFSFAERAMYQPRQRFDREVYQYHFKRMANKTEPKDATENEQDKSAELSDDNKNNNNNNNINTSQESNNNNNDNCVETEEVRQERITVTNSNSNNINNNDSISEIKQSEYNNTLFLEAALDSTQVPPQHSIKTVFALTDRETAFQANAASATTNDTTNKNEKNDDKEYVVGNIIKKKDNDNHHHHYSYNVNVNQSINKSDSNRVIVTRAPVKSKLMRYRKMWTANHLDDHNSSEEMTNMPNASTSNLPKTLYSVSSKSIQQRKQRLRPEQRYQLAKEETEENEMSHEEDAVQQACGKRNELTGINNATNDASSTENENSSDEVYANRFVNHGITQQNRRHDRSNEPTAFIRLPTNTSSINVSTPVHRAVKRLSVQPITRQVHRRVSTTNVRRRSSDNAANTHSACSTQSKQ